LIIFVRVRKHRIPFGGFFRIAFWKCLSNKTNYSMLQIKNCFLGLIHTCDTQLNNSSALISAGKCIKNEGIFSNVNFDKLQKKKHYKHRKIIKRIRLTYGQTSLVFPIQHTINKILLQTNTHPKLVLLFPMVKPKKLKYNKIQQ